MEEDDLVKALEAGKTAVVSSGDVVKAFQARRPQDLDIAVKEDKTLVTACDRASREAGMAVIQKWLPDWPVNAEDGADIAGRAATPGRIRYDALDGTRAFTTGLATSTVIFGVLDGVTGKVEVCVISEPATGRTWYAVCDMPTRRDGTVVRVWPGKMNKQSTVFLDVSHGFARGGRQILNDVQLAGLFTRLNGEVKMQIPGSNGLIQALVANGAPGVAGSITTAIGGSWDVCGVLLVLQAGGHARAFRSTTAGLLEANPLQVDEYDLLITGNSEETVLRLEAALKSAL